MLRVATDVSFTIAAQGINQRQAAMLATQAQLSTGLKINTPSDDPAGAAQASTLTSWVAQLGQYQSNQAQATSQLNQGESTLQQFNDALQSASQDLEKAGNATYTDADRTSLANDMSGILSRMVGLANTTDGNGQFLFAGSKDGTPPFVQTGTSVAYVGDSTPQSLEVSSNRLLQTRFTGDSVFQNIPAGNGTFTTAATSTNTGTGIIGTGTVANPSALTGDSYSVTFGAGGSTYSVTDTTSNTTVVPSTSYTNPSELSFGGMTVSITGAPAAGDSFTVAPAKTQSIFSTMAQAITNLQTSAASPAASAQFNAANQSLLASVNQAMTHISLAQATAGDQLNELTAYQNQTTANTLNSKTDLSNVQDLDYVQASAQLAQQQMSYQAALQSYTMISKLSLFNYL